MDSIDLYTQIQYFRFAAPMTVLAVIFMLCLLVAVLGTLFLTRGFVLRNLHKHYDETTRMHVAELTQENRWLVAENRRLVGQLNSVVPKLRGVQALVAAPLPEPETTAVPLRMLRQKGESK